jgi:hypothetical protein
VKGTIGNISVAGMLRLLCNYKKTGIFRVESSIINGAIEILNGDIVDVIGPRVDKRDALIELLSNIKEGIFYFEEKNIEKKQPLDICIEDAILESARNLYKRYEESEYIKDYLFPENEVLKISKFYDNKILHIKFYTEEWNILVEFNGDNNIKNAIEKSGVDKQKADFIVYGLVAAGLLRRTRFKIPEISKIVRDELGNIGVAIIDSSFMRLNIDKSGMGMKEFLMLLNELENSFSEIIGKTKAKALIEKIWEATK